MDNLQFALKKPDRRMAGERGRGGGLRGIAVSEIRRLHVVEVA
jgi:hypothetical protein